MGSGAADSPAKVESAALVLSVSVPVAYLAHMLQRTFPAGFIAPCLPTKTDKLSSGDLWLHEIKHDGFRVIARKDGDRVRLSHHNREALDVRNYRVGPVIYLEAVLRLCTGQQLRQLLARVEHARLDRVLRNANDLGNLFNRFLVVVYQIDDLPMFRRKSRKALPDHCTLVLLLQRGPGIVRRILDRACGLFVQLLVRSTPERREGLEARDR